MNKEMNEIIETTIELCADTISDNVTYRMIEEKAGKKEGYVFMYFDHKADLINACVETAADSMIKDLAAAFRNKGSVISRFLDADKIMKDSIALIDRLESGSSRNLESASYVNENRVNIYKDLAAALETFIEDGNAQGIFHTKNIPEKAAFISYGLLGLRSCCGNELLKRTSLYNCMESLLGTDLNTYLKIVA